MVFYEEWLASRTRELPPWVHSPEADDFSDRLTGVFVEMVEDGFTDMSPAEMTRKYLGRKHGSISGFSREVPLLPKECRASAGRYFQDLLSLAKHLCAQEPGGPGKEA